MVCAPLFLMNYYCSIHLIQSIGKVSKLPTYSKKIGKLGKQNQKKVYRHSIYYIFCIQESKPHFRILWLNWNSFAPKFFLWKSLDNCYTNDQISWTKWGRFFTQILISVFWLLVSFLFFFVFLGVVSQCPPFFWLQLGPLQIPTLTFFAEWIFFLLVKENHTSIFSRQN